MKNKYLTILVAMGLLSVTIAQADDAPFPNSDFTPYGAEMDGNADGSIPRWQGKSGQQKGFEKAIIEEKPLYEITISNMEKYTHIKK